MHKFIKAIGFQFCTTEKEWNSILKDAEEYFTSYRDITLEDGLELRELKKEFGDRIGIYSYHQIFDDDEQTREYYVPYFEGMGITSYADIIVEKRSDRNAYLGICEDSKVGVSLIFHLQNAMDYLHELQLGDIPKSSTSVTLSGMALSGTVLFPVLKNQEQIEEKNEESRNRMMLLSAARQGDTKAMEGLTLDDIDIYSDVSKRIQQEDIYSIVDTYLMPYGVECDQYSIMGEIIDLDVVKNELTREDIYVMTLDVNELHFDVCVPVEGVTGQPEIGRRFKTNIWLQGHINF